MGWKIQGYAHHSPSYLTGAGVLLCVFCLCYLYMWFIWQGSHCVDTERSWQFVFILCWG